MQSSRIAELLQPYIPKTSERQLSDKDLFSISMYIDILRRWNSRINLTAIRDEEEIVTRHFGESLFAAAHLFPRSGDVFGTGNQAPRVADIGSGAGFPGIPMKIWAPQIALTLIESNHKKATFLREVVRALTLTNVDVLNARAEDSTRQFDMVTMRAVERFKSILPVAVKLLRPSGRVALLVSAAQVEEAHSASSVRWYESIPLPRSASRVLLVGEVEHG
jgi:16S rRNA (guanine527-N7)-methyltransferase